MYKKSIRNNLCIKPTTLNYIPHPDMIIDTEATCTVWKPNNMQVKNLPHHTPIKAQGPSGHAMTSTGEGRLDSIIPEGLPPDILDGHYMPALQKHSIISIGKVVNAGGICTFDKHQCKCYHPTQGTIITGQRKQNELWYLDSAANNNCKTCTAPTINNTVSSMYQHTRIKDTIQFLHAALFSAPKSTIMKAAKSGFLSIWPLLTPTNISKYLSETIATKKGHLS